MNRMILLTLIWLATFFLLVGATQSGEPLPISDQQRCQTEATYMAKHKVCRHVFGCIGRFEGIGCGYNSRPSTCAPRKKMRLTGDATAVSSSGMTYRVRSWR